MDRGVWQVKVYGAIKESDKNKRLKTTIFQRQYNFFLHLKQLELLHNYYNKMN